MENPDLDVKAIEARKEAAHKMIKDLCRRKNDPESRDWIMSIPAREDYDPDLVIGASLRDIPHLLKRLGTPIDMIIHCPSCGKQHIDRPDEPGICECGDKESRHRYINGEFLYCETRHGSNNTECECPGYKPSTWDNPPHKSHLCHFCRCIWRPADVPTNGVAGLKTIGEHDTIHFHELGWIEVRKAVIEEME